MQEFKQIYAVITNTVSLRVLRHVNTRVSFFMSNSSSDSVSGLLR
jgi:hypothetical protein